MKLANTLYTLYGSRVVCQCFFNIFTDATKEARAWVFLETVKRHPSITWVTTSSTAQGGGGSFKNRKPIGEVGCCESGMAERSH
jgi:hypothetical protein